MVAAAFSRRDAADCIAALDAIDIALASVNDMAALSAHPHLRRIRVQTPGGPVDLPAPAPITFGEERSLGPVPALAPDEKQDPVE